MVVGVVAKELFKVAVQVGGRYFKYETKAFNKLYQGFRPGVARGVRHGLAGGSAIGSVLNQGPDTPGNEFQIPFTKQRPPAKTYQSYKTRGRFSGRRRGRNCRQYYTRPSRR